MRFSLLVLALLLGIPQSIGAQEPKTVLVIHGGAGVVPEKDRKDEGWTHADFEQTLARAMQAGFKAMAPEGKTSVDAVEAAIRVLEDSELFNAGRGAVFTSDGRVELDAAIMEGVMEGSAPGKRDPRKRAGAITGVTHVRNPISAARAVLEMEGGRHMMLAGEGAERYVLSEAVKSRFNIERVNNLYFWTDLRLRHIRAAEKKQEKRRADGQEHSGDQLAGQLPAMQRFGTVGCVALDRRKMIAAGTSTGGVDNKWPGRIGDCPVIGAGTYADNRACGVSCTGTGEVFIRHAVAYDVVARMVYGKSNVADAAKATIDNLPDEEGGIGGLIALDHDGRHAFGISKKGEGMYRGFVTEDGSIYVQIYTNDAPKKIELPK